MGIQIEICVYLVILLYEDLNPVKWREIVLYFINESLYLYDYTIVKENSKQKIIHSFKITILFSFHIYLQKNILFFN